jgi:hypothetical protein
MWFKTKYQYSYGIELKIQYLNYAGNSETDVLLKSALQHLRGF